MNRAACFDCRQRASSRAPTTVISCACGWTASYCRTCGGRERAQREIDAHKPDCINARRRAEMNRISRARATIVYVVPPDKVRP